MQILAMPKSSQELNDWLRTYAEVLSLVEENYADKFDPEKSLYDSVRGMLNTLDPHCNFFDPKTYRQFRDDQRGNFFGLGISITMISGKPTVISTLPGSPANRSGIQPGDIVVQIDGKSCEGFSHEQVAEKFRGPLGTTVHLSIQREGIRDLLEFSPVRDEIPQYSIPATFFLRPKIGYIRIESFTETTEKEIDESLKKLGSELEGLILDLRSNPGGSLEAAIGVTDKFLKMGQEVVVTKGRLSSANQKYQVPKGSEGRSFPMVVLINRDSASASEIVAGAVQDHDRGLILGETSFGKGLVQSVFDLSQGAGVALTTAKWYTPSGRLIQRDYAKKSFFDYFNTKREETKPTEIKHTDCGREVYGGGGIRPDYLSDAPRLSSFQSLLLSKSTFFNFVRVFNSKHAEMIHSFEPDDGLLDQFRTFLLSNDITFQDSEFKNNLDFIRRQLKYEYTLSHQGHVEAYRVLLESDAQVLKAIELLPEAKALFQYTEKAGVGRKSAKNAGFK